MNRYFSGFNTKEITLHAGSSVVEGAAVTLSDDCTVEIPAEGELFCGVCSQVRNSLASVVMTGHTTVGFSGAAPAIGYRKLASDGNGAVKLDENGREMLVVDVNEADGTIDIII